MTLSGVLMFDAIYKQFQWLNVVEFLKSNASIFVSLCLSLSLSFALSLSLKALGTGVTCAEFLEESLQATLLPHIPAIQKLTHKLSNKNQRRAEFLEESMQATLLPHPPAIYIYTYR